MRVLQAEALLPLSKAFPDNCSKIPTGDGQYVPSLDVKAELLKLFVAKAGCMHSQRRAGRLWYELRPLLTQGERAALMTAWSHHSHVRLGRGELDSVGSAIAQEWAPIGAIWHYNSYQFGNPLIDQFNFEVASTSVVNTKSVSVLTFSESPFCDGVLTNFIYSDSGKVYY